MCSIAINKVLYFKRTVKDRKPEFFCNYSIFAYTAMYASTREKTWLEQPCYIIGSAGVSARR